MNKREKKNKSIYNKKITRLILVGIIGIVSLFALTGCRKDETSNADPTQDIEAQVQEAVETQGSLEQQESSEVQETSESQAADEPQEIIEPEEVSEPQETSVPENTSVPTNTPTPEVPYNAYETQTISWNPEWEYADYSQIHTDSVTLYKSVHEGRKVIAVNAGHGTKGGSSVKTLCHPDGSPKVTGGSTGKGATYATSISTGTTMLDGTAEATVTLKLAMIVKDRLLDAGFSVLMIRESEDVQLDNIARTVYANQNADCHLSLHYDSTDYDKGFFYMGVPDIASYKSMEPVASHWQQHNALGESLLTGMRTVGVKIFDDGNVPTDLTQTSYSTVPSIDVEVGDRGSDYSDETLNQLADGIVEGVKVYFGVE